MMDGQAETRTRNHMDVAIGKRAIWAERKTDGHIALTGNLAPSAMRRHRGVIPATPAHIELNGVRLGTRGPPPKIPSSCIDPNGSCKVSGRTVGLAQRTPGPLASAMGLFATAPSHFQQHVLVLLKVGHTTLLHLNVRDAKEELP